VDSIKIRCTSSPTLRPITCRWPVVSQPLGAPNQYRAPNLRRLWPWNNTRLISPKNTSNYQNYEQHTTHLTKKYEQLLANYEQLRQMVMNITSQKDDTCAPPFWLYDPGNSQPPPPPPSLFKFNICFGNTLNL